MIGNEISQSSNFGDVVRYCLHGNKKEPNPDKCAWFMERNLPTAEPDVAIKIFEATASQNKAEANCYHFSIDWHKAEAGKLNEEVAIETADRVLEKLGLEEHQAMYFWHVDADHPHMHVVVNRAFEDVDGVYKAHDMWKSKERLEVAVHEVAQELGFEQVQGRHNSPEFEPDRDKGAPQNKKEQVHTDELKPWVKEDIQEIKDTFRGVYQEASNWQELASGLEGEGLHLRKKGQGLIIHDGAKFTQLSKMGKDVRLKDMEAAYGQSYDDFEQAVEWEEVKDFEDLKDWANEPDEEAFEKVDEPDHMDKLNELMSTIDELERFERAQTVQKANNKLYYAGKKVGRQEWLLQKAEGVLAYHEDAFTQMLTEIYKNPTAAKQSIEELHKEGQLKKALAKGRRKHPRWRRIIDAVLKRNRQIAEKKRQKTKREKQYAQKLENRIFYRMQKIREARNRLRERRNQLAASKYHLRQKQKNYDKVKAKRARLNHLRDLSARDINQKTIYASDMPWREKKQLLTLHKRAKGIEADKEKTNKKNRNRNQGLER